MACTTARPLTFLALGLALACNPNTGDDTSASASESSTGSASSDPTGPTTAPTTDGPTSDATSSPTSSPTGDPTSDATSSPTSATESTESTEPGTASTSLTDTGETDTDDTTTGALACGENAEFTASFAAWQAAVELNGATYWYSLLRGGGGFGPPDFCIYRTTVAVADGAVVERRFEVAEIVGNPEPCEAEFTEMGEQIGTQVSDWAATPATVETLYGACCDNVIHIEPAEEYTVTFSTDKEGFMHTCFYVANGCADGCDGGPLGPSLEFEKLEFGAPPAP